ncbi:MAG: N5-glutamine methyltransferase family protein, partial [Actinomycetota bacterium]
MQRLLGTVKEALTKAGLENAEREAEWIVEAASGLTRAELLTASEGPTQEVEDRALEMASRRVAGEPLQYVTGLAGFRRLELEVGPGVFIPRPETEMLAERAMNRLPDQGTAVEIGTGSGAVALAIKDERPDATVVATEY